MLNYLKKNKSDPNKIIENDVASKPSKGNQSSSNNEYEKISADVDNSSIIDTLNSVELQPRELKQEVNYVYDVLDIGFVLKSKTIITDLVKKELLENHWKPPSCYNYPFSTHKKNGCIEKRYVKKEHLDKYEWLVLSKSEGGLFCIYCAIFNHTKTGTGSNNVMPLKCLVSNPLIKFAKLLGKDGYLETHNKNIYHKNSIQDGKAFLNNYYNPKNEVINILNSARHQQVLENRARLKPIIETIAFLGRQNIAIRGHRDDGSLFDDSDTPSENKGNFRELLNFRISAGDETLKNHLLTTQSRATYISKTTQNELIFIMGNLILKKVLDRVKQSKCYSVIFDETTDLSKISQLVTVIRYVYENEVFEDFIGFLDCHQDNYSNTGREVEPKITGELISKSVINILDKFGLPLDKCVGIATDGCSVMLSEKCGAVNMLRVKMKNAIKCSCYSHALNLSIMKGCKIKFIRNAFGLIKEVIHFFSSSAKKNFVLKKTLNSSLQSLCETRWVEKHDCILQFSSGLGSIIDALDEISDWDDISTASKASCLSKSVTTPEFLLTLNIVSEMFIITSPIAKLLQSKSQDKLSATTLIKSVISVLKKKRLNSDECFNKIFENTKQKLVNLGLSDINMPRLTSSMKNRENPQVETAEKYYKIVLFIPFLDELLDDLESRFDEASLSVYDLDVVLPNIIEKKDIFNDKTKIENKILNVVNQFGDVVSNYLNISHDIFEKRITGELTLWHEYWLNEKQLPVTHIDALKRCDYDCFPEINILLNILVTLPATTASAERNFSSLRRIKTWMRTRISEDRLNGLALLHAHRDITINSEDVIDVFAKSNRRLDFVI